MDLSEEQIARRFPSAPPRSFALIERRLWRPDNSHDVDYSFGLHPSFVNCPSLWMRNKSPLKLKYSPVRPAAVNFNWIGLLEVIVALIGLSAPGKVIAMAFLPSL